MYEKGGLRASAEKTNPHSGKEKPYRCNRQLFERTIANYSKTNFSNMQPLNLLCSPVRLQTHANPCFCTWPALFFCKCTQTRVFVPSSGAERATAADGRVSNIPLVLRQQDFPRTPAASLPPATASCLFPDHPAQLALEKQHTRYMPPKKTNTPRASRPRKQTRPVRPVLGASQPARPAPPEGGSMRPIPRKAAPSRAPTACAAPPLPARSAYRPTIECSME